MQHILIPNQAQTVDPIIELMDRFNADPRDDKINLGIGVYQTADGHTPILKAVKEAERQILQSEDTKTYIGVAGRPGYLDRLQAMIFGDVGGTVAAVQSVGGSGALRLLAELCVKATPTRRVWVSKPTWANHFAIFAAAGFEIASYDYPSSGGAETIGDLTIAGLQEARPGDFVLLHATCHNPTGLDPSADDVARIKSFLLSRDLIPILDAAYLGLKDEFSADARVVSEFVSGFPLAACAFSASKNLGLYRERVGAAFIVSSDRTALAAWRKEMMTLARANYSMPPDHGAAIVEQILKSDELTKSWLGELAEMRLRIQKLRFELASLLDRHNFGKPTDHIRQGSGMFCMLPIAKEATDALRVNDGIYMMPSGRINIAGLSEKAVERVATAVCKVS